jgi:hypothetical protein
VYSMGHLTHTGRSDGAPDPDGALRTVTRNIYDDFGRLLLLHVNRESSDLTNEIPEESGQFRFLRAAYYANIKGSVGCE